MNKLLIILPILALLSVGVVFCVAHHNKSISEEVVPTSHKASDITFESWRHCISSLPVNYCVDLHIEDADKLSACKDAQLNVYNFVNFNYDIECIHFKDYSSNSKPEDALNFRTFYQNCYLNDRILTIAQASFDDYYIKIYKPKYITCGGF